jgi:uncharacterized protein
MILRSLLLDLFYHLRDVGKMSLTIVQFENLCQAIEKGYGVADWAALRRVCRVLWVKPHDAYSQEKFDRAFEQYELLCGEAWDEVLRSVEPMKKEEPSAAATVPDFVPGLLPKVPKKLSALQSSALEPETPKNREMRSGISGVKVESGPGSQSAKPMFLQQLPIDGQTVQRTWQRLRVVTVAGQLQELDMDRTVAQIMQTGLLEQVVMRSIGRTRGNVVVLVDEDTPMLPFRPVIQPIVDMVEQRRVGETVLYRFSTYPVDYLYQWQRPAEAIAVSSVLSRLHRSRTLVVIVSDGGAASRTFNPARLQRTGAFLERLLPCVRDVLWVNPLPESRWVGTSAAAIAETLNGRMVSLSELRSRQPMSEGEVQLWKLIDRFGNKKPCQ